MTAYANCGCTKRGGICSNSADCPTTGGEQVKLKVNCRQTKACCKCTGKYLHQLNYEKQVTFIVYKKGGLSV